jgi:hypothetical protein
MFRPRASTERLSGTTTLLLTRQGKFFIQRRDEQGFVEGFAGVKTNSLIFILGRFLSFNFCRSTAGRLLRYTDILS